MCARAGGSGRHTLRPPCVKAGRLCRSHLLALPVHRGGCGTVPGFAGGAFTAGGSVGVSMLSLAFPPTIFHPTSPCSAPLRGGKCARAPAPSEAPRQPTPAEALIQLVGGSTDAAAGRGRPLARNETAANRGPESCWTGLTPEAAVPPVDHSSDGTAPSRSFHHCGLPRRGCCTCSGAVVSGSGNPRVATAPAAIRVRCSSSTLR